MEINRPIKTKQNKNQTHPIVRTHSVPKDDPFEDSVTFRACVTSVPQEGTDLLPEFVFQRQIYNKTSMKRQKSPLRRVSLGLILPPEGYCCYLGIVFLIKTLSLFSRLLLVHHRPRKLFSDFVSVLKSLLVYSPWGYSSVVPLYTQGPGFHHLSTLPEASPFSANMPIILL